MNARYMVKDGAKPSIAAGTTFKESRSNREYCAHAIDPCVLYDNGKLWMSYGSGMAVSTSLSWIKQQALEIQHISISIR
ncbi:MAG: hypothetical protein ACLTHH_08540 [Eubacterium sp.]